MAGTEKNGVDWRTMWTGMLTDEIVSNLSQTNNSNNSSSVHTLKAKMLLKVIFSELRGRIAEASESNRKLEIERAKGDDLRRKNETLNSDVAKMKERLKALESENQSLRDLKLKRNSDEYKQLDEKRLKVEVKKEKDFFVPDTNFDFNSPSPGHKTTIPETLERDEFLLRTPPRGEESSLETAFLESPIITVRRCTSSASASASSESPASHSLCNSQNIPPKTQIPKDEKKVSKLSLSYAAQSKAKAVEQSPPSEFESTFFEKGGDDDDDNDDFKLFDSPKTMKEKKKMEAKKSIDDSGDKKFGFYRGEVVRKKDERNQLPGWECHDCQKFYENFCDGMDTQQKRALINKCSKHRQVQPVLGNTPEDFWKFGILESPKKGTTQVGQLKKKGSTSKGSRLIDKAQAVSISLDDSWD
ncbi:uncharacterized protein LOC135942306 [Cloeon dipterum]|uniref:uncharacterized protein LOC135942306 n=1 Tax=Cloeon dipterum TaxID=197152 RepID=UPI00322009C8